MTQPLWSGPVEMRWRGGAVASIVDYLMIGDMAMGCMVWIPSEMVWIPSDMLLLKGTFGLPRGEFRIATTAVAAVDPPLAFPTEAEARAALVEAAVRALGGGE